MATKIEIARVAADILKTKIEKTANADTEIEKSRQNLTLSINKLEVLLTLPTPAKSRSGS